MGKGRMILQRLADGADLSAEPLPGQPIVEIAKDTYEIDEFDCGSIFVLVGKDKAMVIDTGTGIGDLHAVIRKITDKPIVLVITHAHGVSRLRVCLRS